MANGPKLGLQKIDTTPAKATDPTKVQAAKSLANKYGIDFDPEDYSSTQAATDAGLAALYSKYSGLEQEFADFTQAQQAALGDLQRESARATALRTRRGGSLAGLRGSALETGRKVGAMREGQEAARGEKRRGLLDVGAATAGEIKQVQEAQGNRQARVNDALSRSSDIINAELGKFYSTPGQRRAARDRILKEVLSLEQDPLVIEAVLSRVDKMMGGDTAGRIDF